MRNSCPAWDRGPHICGKRKEALGPSASLQVKCVCVSSSLRRLFLLNQARDRAAPPVSALLRCVGEQPRSGTTPSRSPCTIVRSVLRHIADQLQKHFRRTLQRLCTAICRSQAQTLCCPEEDLVFTTMSRDARSKPPGPASSAQGNREGITHGVAGVAVDRGTKRNMPRVRIETRNSCEQGVLIFASCSKQAVRILPKLPITFSGVLYQLLLLLSPAGLLLLLFYYILLPPVVTGALFPTTHHSVQAFSA